MKLSRKIKLLILIVMSLSVYFIYKYTNNNNINYTAIGDSLSYGKDCYGRLDYGYSDYLKDYLNQNNKLNKYSKEYTQEQMSIDSIITSLLSEEKMNYNSKKDNLKTILRDSNYLTITIGLSDLMTKLNFTGDYTDENLNKIIKEIDYSFDNLIKEIKKFYSHKIYVVGYYNKDKNNKFLNKAIYKLNNIFKTNSNVIYISTTDLTKSPNVFFPNPTSYYPNYKGYQYISSKIQYKMLKKLDK